MRDMNARRCFSAWEDAAPSVPSLPSLLVTNVPHPTLEKKPSKSWRANLYTGSCLSEQVVNSSNPGVTLISLTTTRTKPA